MKLYLRRPIGKHLNLWSFKLHFEHELGKTVVL